MASDPGVGLIFAGFSAAGISLGSSFAGFALVASWLASFSLAAREEILCV